MKQRVRVQKSAAAAKTTSTNRLTDIVVNEVSIVDRAANQRKYLVVKNGKAAEPPALKLAAEVKKKVSAAVEKAQQQLAAIAKAVDAAVETPDAELPKDVVESCFALVSEFATGCSLTVEPATPTAKAGKKISAARMKLLRDAQTAINAVLADAEEEPKPDAGEGTTKSEGDENDGDEPEKKDLPAEPKPQPPQPKTPSEPPKPSAFEQEIKTTVDKLAGAVTKMTHLFEGQNARLDTLAKARGSSQQVDLDEKPIRKQHHDVAWPMDMARERRAQQ